jgi:cytochrome P450
MRLRDEIIASTAKEASDSGFEDASSDTASESSASSSHLFQSLPLLDGVVRETLRLCSPVHDTIRVATCNDQIPISHPVTLQNGTVIAAGGTISIRKGSFIHIPINGLNHEEDVFGPDCDEFRSVVE